MATFLSFLASFSPNIKPNVTFYPKNISNSSICLKVWNNYKEAHSNHNRQRNLNRTSQKWQKYPNFPNIWNIKANFWNKNSQKNIKIYINIKTILSAFQCFLFHNNYIYFLSYCIITGTILYMNYQNIFGQFSPHFAHIFNQI